MKNRPTRIARTAESRRRSLAFHPLSVAICLGFSGLALAAPQGGTVVAGQATITQPTPTSQVINQTTNKAIIDWKSFSIATGEKVRFNQPSTTSVTLNRVTGYDPSYILGEMSSNGKIFLVNPYGVVFGAGARIDVGGLVASSLSIANSDFLAGHYSLTSVEPGAPAQRGEVRNEGTITAPGGTVVLAGPTVTNTGTIVADGGRVGMVAANAVSVDVEGDGLLFFQTSATEAKNRLQQLGRIQADGGSIEMRAAARGAFADTVLNMTGIVQAKTIGTREGRIVIDGGSEGVVAVAGKIDATGLAAGERGGKVVVQGQRVLIDNGAALDASGSAGGGSILIGGDLHGANPEVRNAEYTGVAETATIRADAIDAGHGGKVVVWADQATRYYGTISARGGREGGDGGFVEVSGKDTLIFRGDVSTTAPKGKAGTLLLDPTDISIVDAASSANDNQLNADDPPGDLIGVISVGESPASMTISSAKLEDIASANNIDLQASNSITIADLQANVLVSKTLTLATAGSASFSAGAGGFNMATDNRINVTNGSLSITTPSGPGPISVGSLQASGGITLNGTAVATNGTVTAGGAISVTATSVALGGAIAVTTAGMGVAIAAPITLASGGGSITLTGTNAGNDVTLGTVNGARPLVISAAGGDLTIGAIGGTTPLTAVTLTANTASLQGVTTTGAQNYSGVTTTTLNGALSVNTAGAGVSAGAVTLGAGGGTIGLTGSNAANDVTLGTVNGAQALDVTAGGGDIVLGAVGPTVTGVSLTGNTASLAAVSTTGAQNYSGVTSTTLNGTLAVSTAGAGVTAGNVTLAAGGGAVNLTGTNAGNDVSLGNVNGPSNLAISAGGGDVVLGTVGPTTTGVTITANTASLQAVTTPGAQNYSGVTSTTLNGTLSVTAAGAGVSAGAVTLAAGSGTISLTGSSAANDVTLGTVTGAQALVVTAGGGDIVLGTVDPTVTTVTLSGNSASLQAVTTTGAQDYSAVGTTTLHGALAVSTAGLGVTAGNVSLAAGGGAITLTGNDAGNDVSLGTVNGAQALAVTATGGDVVLGTTGAGTALTTVTLAANTASLGAVTTSGAQDYSAVATTTLNGTLTVNAAGAGVSAGTVLLGAASGTIALTGSNAANDVTLGTVNGAQTLAVTAGGGDIVVGTLGGSTPLAGVSLSGNTASIQNVTSTGNQSYAAQVSAGAVTLDAGSGAITATNANNNFTGALSLTGGTTQITDSNALTLGTVATGALTVTSTGALDLGSGSASSIVAASNGGAVSQAGALIVSGTTSVNAGASTIALGNAGNDFTGAVALTTTGANNATVRDTNALVLGPSSVGGNLDVTARGNISETGALQVTGTSTFTVDTAALADVLLASNANNFTGTVTIATTGGATLRDVGLRNDSGTPALPVLSLGGLRNLDLQFTNAAISVPTVSLSGTLNVVAGGAITQAAGGVQVAGASSFTAGANAIILNDAANNFTGPVSVANSGNNNVSITDTNAIVLGASSTGSGTFSVSAGGNISEAGALLIGGASTFTATAAGTDIALASANNNFVGPITVATAGAGTIDDLALRNVNAAAAIPVLPATLHDLDLQFTNAAIALPTLNLSGALSVLAGGPVTQQPGTLTVAGATSVNAGGNAITLTMPGNDFIGAVSLNNSGANNVAVADTNAIVLGASNVGTGTLGVTAAGPITQTGAIVQAAGAGTASFAAGANAIVLNNPGNNFTGAVALGNTGANPVVVTDQNALILGTSNVGTGPLTVTAGGPITQTGAIVQAAGAAGASFIAGANAITLGNGGNDFTGAVSFTNSGNNNVALVDSGTLVLGASNVGTGTFTVTSTGAITQAGGIVQAAGAAGAAFNAGANAIALGSGGNDFTGAVSFTNSGANNVSVVDGNGIVLGASTVGSGTFSVAASGPITQTGAIVQAAAATGAVFSAGANAIALNTAGNDFTGAVTLSNSGNNNVAVTDVNALVLGASNVGSGTLSVTAAGPISQTGAIIQAAGAGSASFNAGASTIALGNAGNDFTGAVALTTTGANNATVRDTNALVLGPSSVGGNLDVTARGNISETGALQVTGTSTFTVDTAALADVLLASNANNFTGTVTIATTGGATLRDVGLRNDSGTPALPVLSLGGLRNLDLQFTNAAISVPTVNLSGTLNVVAGGAITQAAGGVQVAGASSFTAGANAIILNDAANNFTGPVSVANSGNNNVSITDTNAIVLGASSTGSGTFSVSAGGAITQAGAIVQAPGAASANFNAGANAITLGNGGNDFTGAVNLTGGTTQVVDSNALNLGTLATGALTVTSNGALGLGSGSATSMNASSGGGAVTQAGTLTVSGATSVDAGAGTVVLTAAGNNFGSIGATGSTVTINDVNAVALDATNATTLTVTAGGAVTQNAGVVVSGTTSVNAGANAVTLTSATNNFGSIGVTGGAVAISDSNAMALDTIVATSLTVSTASNGNVSQNATATVTGATLVNAGTGAIALSNAGNNFGSVAASGGAVSVTDINALTLGPISASSLTVNTAAGNGAVTQSGAAVVTGASTINAGTGAVALVNAGNDFATLGVTGGAIGIVDANALALNGLVSAPNQTVSVVAGGTLSLPATAIDTGTAALTLTSGGPLTTVGTLRGTNVALTSAGAMTLANDVTALGTLGLTTTNAPILQTGGAIVANGTATVSAGSGDITLAQPSNNFQGSVVLSGGAVSVRDVDNLAVTSLVSGANRPVSLIAGGSLSLPPSAIDTGSADLTLQALGGTLVINGPLSGNTVTLTGTAGLTLGADITSSGDQIYTTTVQLGGNVTLNAGGSKIDLQGGANGNGNSLALTSSNAAADAIHTGAAISNTAQFTVTGNSTLGGNVTTTGNQSYSGPVTLGTDVALASGAARIDLQSSVDAAGHNLALTSSNAAADAIHAAGVIANAAQLTVTGKSTFSTGVTTTGAQLYSDTVTLGSTASFVGSSLAFGNGIAAGTFDLGLRSDVLTLAGTVSGSGNASLSPLTQGATIGVAGGAGTYQLSQATLNAFSSFAGISVGRADGSGDLTFGNLVLPTQLSVVSGSGDVDFTGTVASAAGQGRNLGVATGGSTTFGSAVGGAIGGTAALGNLSVAGATQLNASTTANGSVSLVGPVTVGADATVSAAAVSLGSTLDIGSHALTVLSDSLTVAGAATGSGGGSVRIAPKDAAGSMGVGGGVGTLQVSQGLIDTFAGVPTLTLGRNDSTGTITAGSLTLPTDLAIANGSGAVAFTGSVDSAAGPARDLTVTTTGTTSFAGTVGTTRALDTLSVSGSAQFGANIVTTGAQTYSGPATLLGDSTLTGPSVSFGSTVDGARALTVNAAATNFAGAVGGATALTSLTTDAAGTTQLGGNVTTSGGQTYNDALLLNGNAVLTGSTLNLAGSVDGARTLTLSGSTGVTLGGPIGAGTALAGLSVAGPLQLNAGSVTTTGAQSYASATTLGAAATLSAPSIAFGNTLDGGFALTTQSPGPTSFAGAVGATTALASLTANGGGAVLLSGPSVDTSGAQSYSGALQLTGSSRLTGSALTLTGPVSGATDLTLQANALTGGSSIAGTGVLTIAPRDPTLSIGVAGGTGTLQVSQAVLDGASGFSGHVIGRTDGSGTLSTGNLLLRADTTLQSATGDLDIGSVDGAFALALNSGGTTRIAGPVGAGTPLASLTTDNNAAAADWNGTTGERTSFDTADGTGAARVITSGAQTYNDPVTASVPVAFSGGAITATQAANRFDGAVSANAISLDLHNAADLTLGTLTLVNGGSLETDGVLRIAGAVQLNGGVLTLTSNATPTPIDLTDPEYAGKALSFGFVPIKEASPTIVQDVGGTLGTAAGSLLVLRAPAGGSISLEQPGNTLLGQVSAVSGTLGDNDVSRFNNATGELTLGFLRIVSSEIHVAGRPPANGDQGLQQAGLEGDVIKLTADVLTTGPDGLIRARLPFNNIQGSQTSIPGLTLAMTPTALLNGGGFGGPESENFIQVQVGGDEGGFLSARPKGTSGDTAVIFLGGDSSVTPFYDGAGKITEIRIFYNGDAPRTPQETGALAAVIALIEDARQARFEEAVRTENVRSRLRSGVIAEVGAGRPATVGRESIRLPDTCEIKPKTLLCE